MKIKLWMEPSCKSQKKVYSGQISRKSILKIYVLSFNSYFPAIFSFSFENLKRQWKASNAMITVNTIQKVNSIHLYLSKASSSYGFWIKGFEDFSWTPAIFFLKEILNLIAPSFETLILQDLWYKLKSYKQWLWTPSYDFVETERLALKKQKISALPSMSPNIPVEECDLEILSLGLLLCTDLHFSCNHARYHLQSADEQRSWQVHTLLCHLLIPIKTNSSPKISALQFEQTCKTITRHSTFKCHEKHQSGKPTLGL